MSSYRFEMTAEEFDNYIIRAKLEEQERIIGLLEADVCPDSTVTCCDGACSAYKDAIALIKGNKDV